jgi:HD superfamily phosphohydrolase
MPTCPVPSPKTNPPDLLQYWRTIRDPIYKYIPITRLEDEILSTEAFQRLDRISQAHSVPLVYPSARYSRKCHSLGAMHLIHRAFASILYKQHQPLQESVPPLFFKEPIIKSMDGLDELSEIWPLDGPRSPGNLAWAMQGVRLAGLLHDLGHAPFSHLFESICREAGVTFRHEEMSRRIVKEVLLPEVNGLDEQMAEFVCMILSNKADEVIINGVPLPFLYELISGPINCDKLDYLVRDAYHAGTLEYGQLDVERIIDSFLVKGGSLKINESHLDCVMDYFHSVFYMYNAVYFHKTCRSFDIAIGQALKEQSTFLEKIIENPGKLYDEISFISEIKNGFPPEGEVYRAIDRFLNRKKTFKFVARKRFNLRLDWLDISGWGGRDIPPEILDLEEKIFAHFKGEFDFKADTGAKSRPVGIRPKDILEWLRSNNIYDSNSKKFKPLKDVSSIDYSYLEQMTIPITVFIPREEYLGLLPEAFSSLKGKANEFLQTQLEEVRKKYVKIQQKLERLAAIARGIPFHPLFIWK